MRINKVSSYQNNKILSQQNNGYTTPNFKAGNPTGKIIKIANNQLLDVLTGLSIVAIASLKAEEKLADKEPVQNLLFQDVKEFEISLTNEGWDEYPKEKAMLINAYKHNPAGMSVYLNTDKERDFMAEDFELQSLKTYERYPEASSYLLAQIDTYKNIPISKFRGKDIQLLAPLYDKYGKTFKEIINDKELNLGSKNLWMHHKNDCKIIPEIIDVYEKNPELVRHVYGSEIKKSLDNEILSGMINAGAEHPRGLFKLLNNKVLHKSFAKDSMTYIQDKDYFEIVLNNLETAPEYVNKFYNLRFGNINRGELQRGAVEWAVLYPSYKKNPELFNYIVTLKDDTVDTDRVKYSVRDVVRLIDKAETAPNAVKTLSINPRHGLDADIIIDIADYAEINPEATLKLLNAKDKRNRYVLNTQQIKELLKISKDCPEVLDTLSEAQPLRIGNEVSVEEIKDLCKNFKPEVLRLAKLGELTLSDINKVIGVFKTTKTSEFI